MVYNRANSAFAQASPNSYNWDTALPEAKSNGFLHMTGITPLVSQNSLKAFRDGTVICIYMYISTRNTWTSFSVY